MACYEGETTTDAATDPGADAGAAAGDAGKQTTFTQEQVNRYVAEDRRKTEQKFKTQMKAELEKQEKLYNELLTNKNLTEQERDSLRESLAAVEKELHTKEELLRREKKTVEDSLGGKLKDAESKAQAWEQRYVESTINRELVDAAASNDAYNQKQLVSLLRPKTKTVEVTDAAGKGTGEFQIVVALDDVVDGKPVVTELSPDAAVKRMKALPEMYGNLFKSNVVSGVGANTATGSQLPGGKLDLKSMSQAQYREIRAKHPELLGLRPKCAMSRGRVGQCWTTRFSIEEREQCVCTKPLCSWLATTTNSTPSFPNFGRVRAWRFSAKTWSRPTSSAAISRT